MSQKSNYNCSPLENRFYVALGRYMQSFSLLDLNLGLCIGVLVNRLDSRVAHPFLQRLSTHQKIRVFKELIFYKYANDNPTMFSDFDQWIKRAMDAKAGRNKYVHGVWQWISSNYKTPIRLTPISWAYGPDPKKDERPDLDMTLSDFEEIVAEMTDVVVEFNELRGKCGI